MEILDIDNDDNCCIDRVIFRYLMIVKLVDCNRLQHMDKITKDSSVKQWKYLNI